MERIRIKLLPIELKTVVFALDSLIANQDDPIFNEHFEDGTVLGGEALERFRDDLALSKSLVELDPQT